jgi:hypothetical protein
MTYNINFLRRTKIEISDALHSLCPGARWSVEDTYESIKNYQSNKYRLPPKEEVEAEVQRLQNILDSYQYQRDRKNEYPSIEDQLDLLYHQGYEGWKQEIDRVKEMHPKPNS